MRCIKVEVTTDMFEEMRAQLLERLDNSREISDEEILEEIDQIVLKSGKKYCLCLKEREEMRKDLFYSIRRLDILQELLDDPQINEIMVNGPENIFYEKKGKMHRFAKKFTHEERLMDIIQIIAGECNRVVNEQSPIVDARLKSGDRVNIVLPPVALDGPILTIRKFPKTPITMEDLIGMESLTRQAAQELELLIAAGYTIIVSGGTSTGKTTFLNALSQYISPQERIITIEDNAELQLIALENLVRLEAKPANLEENREITIRDLIKTALRMRPSRIIIGEVRGAETQDFLNCLNTGHEGSLGSVHANSPEDLVFRLEGMVRMGSDLPIPVIRQQIAAGLEIIVQLYRNIKGKRMVEKIAEVTGFDGKEVSMQILYERNKRGELEKKNELQNQQKKERYLAFSKE